MRRTSRSVRPNSPLYTYHGNGALKPVPGSTKSEIGANPKVYASSVKIRSSCWRAADSTNWLPAVASIGCPYRRNWRAQNSSNLPSHRRRMSPLSLPIAVRSNWTQPVDCRAHAEKVRLISGCRAPNLWHASRFARPYSNPSITGTVHDFGPRQGRRRRVRCRPMKEPPHVESSLRVPDMSVVLLTQRGPNYRSCSGGRSAGHFKRLFALWPAAVPLASSKTKSGFSRGRESAARYPVGTRRTRPRSATARAAPPHSCARRAAGSSVPSRPRQPPTEKRVPIQGR